jgi:hypothetical protein
LLFLPGYSSRPSRVPCVTYRDRVGQDPLHPRVRREGLALLNADRGEEASGFHVDRVQRLFLDDLVDVLVEGVVVGMNGVVRNARPGDPLHLRRVLRLRERVDLQMVLHTLLRHVESVLDGGAQKEPVFVCPGPDHEVAVRHNAFVSRRQNKVLAALALVRAGRTNVRDVTEPGIVNHALHGRRRFHNRRTVTLEVEAREDVHRRGVGGQKKRLGIHQLVEDDNLVGFPAADMLVPFDELMQ